MLIEAQKAAARSERPVDYDLLSELLLHRVKNDSDREKRLGIKKAVEIVDSISDEALLGLTVFHAVSRFSPESGDLDAGLDRLDNLFNTLFYSDLPEGTHWIDHLDLLGAIRVNPIRKLMPLLDYYSNMLDGYVCVGILKGSENYFKAIDLFASIGVSKDFLVDNVLNPSYVRLNFPQQNSFESINKLIAPNVMIPLSAKEIITLNNIVSLYNKDPQLLQNVKNSFSGKWKMRKSLNQLNNWWEKIPYAFTLTEMGIVLAHANAQRCDNSLPALN